MIGDGGDVSFIELEDVDTRVGLLLVLIVSFFDLIKLVSSDVSWKTVSCDSFVVIMLYVSL